MTEKRSILKQESNDSPSPGSYSPSDRAIKSSAPNFGFGTDKKNKELEKTNGPSPLSYEVKDSLLKRGSQSTSMGYGKKVDPAKVLVDTPGPGSYVNTLQ